jgi:hypothetical protein
MFLRILICSGLLSKHWNYFQRELKGYICAPMLRDIKGIFSNIVLRAKVSALGSSSLLWE